MPEIIEGEECLNKLEIRVYLGWSYSTVENHLKDHTFPHWTIPGKGRAKYYRKSDVDKMKEPQKGV